MVKFKKSFRNYGVGDVAGFSKQHEAWLIDKNIAEKQVKKEAAHANETGPAKGTTAPKPPTVKPEAKAGHKADGSGASAA